MVDMRLNSSIRHSVGLYFSLCVCACFV